MRRGRDSIHGRLRHDQQQHSGTDRDFAGKGSGMSRDEYHRGRNGGPEGCHRHGSRHAVIAVCYRSGDQKEDGLRCQTRPLGHSSAQLFVLGNGLAQFVSLLFLPFLKLPLHGLNFAFDTPPCGASPDAQHSAPIGKPNTDTAPLRSTGVIVGRPGRARRPVLN
jgi:hypothetical protein